MPMVHATSVYAPNTISVRIEDKRRQTLRLEAGPRNQITPTNSIS
jgi:hypothetical protein